MITSTALRRVSNSAPMKPVAMFTSCKEDTLFERQSPLLDGRAALYDRAGDRSLDEASR